MNQTDEKEDFLATLDEAQKPKEITLPISTARETLLASEAATVPNFDVPAVSQEVLDGLENADPTALFKEVYLQARNGQKLNLRILQHVMMAAEKNPMIHLQLHNYASTDQKFVETLTRLTQHVVKLHTDKLSLKQNKDSPFGGGFSVVGLQRMLANLQGTDSVLASKTYTMLPIKEEENEQP